MRSEPPSPRPAAANDNFPPALLVGEVDEAGRVRFYARPRALFPNDPREP